MQFIADVYTPAYLTVLLLSNFPCYKWDCSETPWFEIFKKSMMHFWKQSSWSRLVKFHFRSCQIVIQEDCANLYSWPQCTRARFFLFFFYLVFFLIYFLTDSGWYWVMEIVFISVNGVFCSFNWRFFVQWGWTFFSHAVGRLTPFFVNCLFLKFGS